MVAIHIITEEETTAHEIVNYLLEKKMLLEAVLLEKVISKKTVNGGFEAKKGVLIIGITKALLFRRINEDLNQHFGENKFTLYSLPVVDMDLDKQKELIQTTLSV